MLEEQIRDIVGIEDVSFSEIAGASSDDGDCYSDEISEADFEKYFYRAAPPPYTGGMGNGGGGGCGFGGVPMGKQKMGGGACT